MFVQRQIFHMICDLAVNDPSKPIWHLGERGDMEEYKMWILITDNRHCQGRKAPKTYKLETSNATLLIYFPKVELNIVLSEYVMLIAQY